MPGKIYPFHGRFFFQRVQRAITVKYSPVLGGLIPVLGMKVKRYKSVIRLF